MKQIIGISLMGFATLVMATPAEAQPYITIIHAVQGRTNDWTSNFPIDIEIDGDCSVYKTFGARLGPEIYEPGDHRFKFYVFKPGFACGGQLLAEATVNVGATTEVDLVLQEDPNSPPDNPGIITSIWDNTGSLEAVDTSKTEVAIEVRHAAAAGLVTFALDRKQDELNSGDFRPGETIEVDTEAGIHTMTISDGSTELDSRKGNCKKNRAYWVYVVGAASNDSLKLLNIEMIPDEPE